MTTESSSTRFKYDGLYYNIIDPIRHVVELTYQKKSFFHNYKKLRSVVIPASFKHNGTTYSVEAIGEDAFAYCTSLTSLTIPGSVTAIGHGAFSSCWGLVHITISSRITKIEPLAFSGCKNIESIVVSPDNPVYDSRGGCNAIIETATNTLIVGCKNTIITDDITSFDLGAFCNFGVASNRIPPTISFLPDYTFDMCYSLTSIVVPDSVKAIGGAVFRGCTYLTSAVLPKHIKVLSNLTFMECTALSSVVLSEDLEQINVYAFAECTSLSSITIPARVRLIKCAAFEHCHNLQNIYVHASIPPIVEGYAFDDIHPSAVLHVPASSLGDYCQSPWRDYFDTILPI